MKYIFVHGLGQKPSSWDKTIHCISKGNEVACPDRSLLKADRECTYDNLYHAFSVYCDGVLQPLNLCGLSLGAVLALHYTIKNPQKVSSLVLIAPQYKMPKKLLKFQNAVFRLMPGAAFQSSGFSKWDFIQLTTSMSHLDFSSHLDNISCPMLVVCGDKDKANQKASEKLAGSISTARLQYIENSGHEVNIEKPEKLAEFINDFYNKQGL